MTQQTPQANRFHIGFFGKRNSGKSTLINELTGKERSLVSSQPGTTTDLVFHPLELPGLGPSVLIDTAGFDDVGLLGELRSQRTRDALARIDLLILVITPQEDWTEEQEFLRAAAADYPDCPVLIVLNQDPQGLALAGAKDAFTQEVLLADATQAEQREALLGRLSRFKKEDPQEDLLRVGAGEWIVLVMPQDEQAPEGRIILPQVQTLRALLDQQAITICVQPDQLADVLAGLQRDPAWIITDSQVFDRVFPLKPERTKLTSFSILFAKAKGDLAYFREGINTLRSLRGGDRVLIAEACAHVPGTEDIGRVKIPRLLRRKIADDLQIEFANGAKLPPNIKDYRLIIQCGACMFNRKLVLSRVAEAKAAGVPMTNYGLVLAELNQILERVDWD